MALTWTEQGAPPAGFYTMGAAGGGVAVFVGNTGLIARTDDGGATWTTPTSPWGTDNINRICYDPVLGFFIVSNTGTARSTDGGATWTQVDAFSFARGIGSNGAGTVVALSFFGSARYTTNGTTWTSSGSLSGSPQGSVVAGGPDGIWLGTTLGLYFSATGTSFAHPSGGSSNWTSSGSNSVAVADGVFFGSVSNYPGSNGCVIASDDNGASWLSEFDFVAGTTGASGLGGILSAAPGKVILDRSDGIYECDVAADPSVWTAYTSVAFARIFAWGDDLWYGVENSGRSGTAPWLGGAPPAPPPAFWTDKIGTYEVI